MLSRWLGYAAVALLGWWAWTGPVQDWRTVSPEEQLEEDARAMAHCVRGKTFAAGAGGPWTQDPEAACAREHGLYRHEGRWYRLDVPRPGGAGQGASVGL